MQNVGGRNGVRLSSVSHAVGGHEVPEVVAVKAGPGQHVVDGQRLRLERRSAPDAPKGASADCSLVGACGKVRVAGGLRRQKAHDDVGLRKGVLSAAQGFKVCGESGPLENQAVLEPGCDAVEFEPEFGGKGEETVAFDD